MRHLDDWYETLDGAERFIVAMLALNGLPIAALVFIVCTGTRGDWWYATYLPGWTWGLYRAFRMGRRA